MKNHWKKSLCSLLIIVSLLMMTGANLAYAKKPDTPPGLKKQEDKTTGANRTTLPPGKQKQLDRNQDIFPSVPQTKTENKQPQSDSLDQTIENFRIFLEETQPINLGTEIPEPTQQNNVPDPVVIPAQQSPQQTFNKIRDNQDEIENIKERIEAIKDSMAELEKKQVSLATSLELLDQQYEIEALEIESLELEKETLNLEIDLININRLNFLDYLEFLKQELQLSLHEIHVDDQTPLLLRLIDLHSVRDLVDLIKKNEQRKIQLSINLSHFSDIDGIFIYYDILYQDLDAILAEYQEYLHNRYIALEEINLAKELLLSETNQTEEEFQKLIAELEQEEELIQRLARQSEARYRNDSRLPLDGDLAFLWPVDQTYRGISSTFHDPTYPFRYLFEHSGIDVPQKQGSPVVASESGYVSLVKYGSAGYGYYVMITHGNGFSTLYAHLSRIDVAVDQFVEKGDVIALSGGAAGVLGSGLSTGPHIHFEIRSDGSAIDPLPYLF